MILSELIKAYNFSALSDNIKHNVLYEKLQQVAYNSRLKTLALLDSFHLILTILKNRKILIGLNAITATIIYGTMFMTLFCLD
jgi:hypothetical protein